MTSPYRSLLMGRHNIGILIIIIKFNLFGTPKNISGRLSIIMRNY